ncbi:cytochrome P450 2G1-like [Erpetoichthys calabaricus]|uniref:cytochrome P450 2G1-like n=1 Tax=Erpetoichthys calabaricus TaxID=27687 RepID=UPI0010A0BFA7|nr:cytochrome P450 2G1-like [Erpetoichthys calabaricus]
MEAMNTLILTAIFLSLLLMWLRRDSTRYARMPPGPTPLPLIGNLLQITGNVPYKHFLKLSETYGPVMTVHLGGLRVVVLVGYEAVQEALVQHADSFAGRPKLPLFVRIASGYGVITSNGDNWKHMRRFSLTTLRNFGMGKHSIEQYIQEEAQHLVEKLCKTKGSPFDPSMSLSQAVANVICSIVFGERFEYDDENFAHLLALITNSLLIFSRPLAQMYNMFPKLFNFLPGPHKAIFGANDELKQFTSTFAEKHRKDLSPDSPQDFIDTFFKKMKQESANPNTVFHCDNLVQSVLELFVAGTETTSTTLRFGFLILIKYPHIQEKVQKEIDEVIGHQRSPTMADKKKMPYTNAVIHEIQRLADLVPMNLPHATTEDTHFRNYMIPEGTIVLPLLHSVLHDKKLFKSPHSFDPGHFLDETGCFKMNPAFIPFSTGKRVCLGESLAQMELFLFFTTLLQNLSLSSTEDPANLSLLPCASSFLNIPMPYTLLINPR